ncbi:MULTISPECIES: ABC transporter ATP-binding protein [Micromonospora]|uniref:Daunorubicin resistance ABC transporter ATPase subunit n=1 Tax=Verrucosispora sp. MS100047 TaxID=1410949 RepID=A0A097CS07_9ACTN|nr:ABC transporter ATP-binding protein [Verrucosispora sp. FIM060022]AIS85446.1 daunorubicin resistance ABC transporter ATPase subunit [Verrucosispora sp. MS100047]RUL94600.1 ABC transporter ATP-binding protein [Verrucosispora sp. FIM060022]
MSVTTRNQTEPPGARAEVGAGIEAVDLVKSYAPPAARGRGRNAPPPVPALRGVSFAAPQGTILGLLGPNGAGKTTAVKILTTLSTPDSGTALVAGIDVAKNPTAVRRVIGYVPQKPSFDPNLTGRENLILQARIYGANRADAGRDADAILARFGLSEAAGRITRKWSGGMQRKLDVAMALIHSPKVLFLDEPTTGLDPEARSELWTAIADLTRAGDLTVLLTTHYLEEADRLADHLVIVDRGTVVASGSPEQLKDGLAGDTIHAGVASPDLVESARAALLGVDGIDEVTVDGTDLYARAASASRVLAGVVAAFEAAGVPLATVTAARPSLEQVYLHHAGRSYRSAQEDRREEESA